MFAAAAAWLAFAAPGTALAQTQSAPNAAAATNPSNPGALGCIIEPSQTADVAAPGPGVIQAVLVDRGQTVRKGQLIATMTSDVERATLSAARGRAEADAEIGAAGAAREATKLKLRRVYELSQLGFASQQELDQARSEYEIADYRLFQAREAQSIARRELQVAEQQLELRQVRSPIQGIVADRLLNPGERADGRPIVRVMALERLRVEVVLPSQHFGRVREGMSLPVTPDIPEALPVNAQVVQVDRFVDTASGTFRSRLLLANDSGNVPAGVRCLVALHSLPSTAMSKAPAPAAAGTPQAKSGGAASTGRTGVAIAPRTSN